MSSLCGGGDDDSDGDDDGDDGDDDGDDGDDDDTVIAATTCRAFILCQTCAKNLHI